MYDIIVIDDEFIIRDGISTLVDWEKLGFHVAKVFEDGEQAVDWLQHNHTDVILTDLFLGGISGIDVAKYVYTNQMPAKVVILSGHSDFTAAQQALDYKVAAFLLKPISIRRLREVFTKLREELDILEHLRTVKKNTVQGGEMAQYFAEDLVSGVLKSAGRLQRHVEMLKLQDFLAKPCGVVSLSICQYDRVLHEFDGDGKSLESFVWNNMNRGGVFLPLYHRQNRLLGLMLGAKGEPDAFLQGLIRKITALVRIDIQAAVLARYASLPELVDGWPYPWFGHSADISIADIRERQQITMAYILQGDTDQVHNHYHTLLASLPGDFVKMKTAAVDYIAGLVEHLRTESRGVEDDGVFPYNMLFDAATPQALRMAGFELLSLLIDRAKIDKNHSKHSLIDRACRLIDGNFVAGVSLEEAAEALFISPAYLSKLFKEVTGVNFKEYIIDKRIAYACTLLSGENDYKVYDICRMAGYSDLKYFHQLFARKMGCAPMAYRAQSASAHAEE